MEIDLSDPHLSRTEKNEIERLLQRKNKDITDDLSQMWYLIDLVWDDIGCDNQKMEWQKIKAFYAHPVWLLNGLFIEQHEISKRHRHSISDWVVDHGLKNVVDYGGGFGTLARFIAEKDDRILVDIFEPYPSEFGIKRTRAYPNVRVLHKLKDRYDGLLCTDVLEHVPDPLADLSVMIQCVKTGGYLIIANAFFPMIKCHLPETFHLRFTFGIFARMMGLQDMGPLCGSHATIFRKKKNKEVDWKLIRRCESISRRIFPLVDSLYRKLRAIKAMVIK